MTNEQCKALIMGALYSGKPPGASMSQMYEVERRAGALMEGAGAVVTEYSTVQELPTNVRERLLAIEQRLNEVGEEAFGRVAELEGKVTHLQGIAKGMDGRFGNLEKQDQSTIAYFKGLFEPLQREVKELRALVTPFDPGSLPTTPGSADGT